MPRQNRLSHADFDQLGKAQRVPGDFFVLSIYPINGRASKYACVVSKKTAMRANVRNRIRRWCRAVIQTHKNGDKKPQIFIFTAKKSVIKASFEEVLADIAKLLSRANS